jgi:hypothetical protein
MLASFLEVVVLKCCWRRSGRGRLLLYPLTSDSCSQMNQLHEQYQDVQQNQVELGSGALLADKIHSQTAMKITSGSLTSFWTREEDVQEDDQEVGPKDGSEIRPRMWRLGEEGGFGCQKDELYDGSS